MINGKHWPRRDWARRVLLNSTAPPIPRLILAVFATECDAYGEVAMTVADISSRAGGISRRETQNGLRKLEALQEIRALEKKGGRGIPSRYQLSPHRTQKGANDETPLALPKGRTAMRPLPQVYSRARA